MAHWHAIILRGISYAIMEAGAVPTRATRRSMYRSHSGPSASVLAPLFLCRQAKNPRPRHSSPPQRSERVDLFSPLLEQFAKPA